MKGTSHTADGWMLLPRWGPPPRCARNSPAEAHPQPLVRPPAPPQLEIAALIAQLRQGERWGQETTSQALGRACPQGGLPRAARSPRTPAGVGRWLQGPGGEHPASHPSQGTSVASDHRAQRCCQSNVKSFLQRNRAFESRSVAVGESLLRLSAGNTVHRQ